MVSEDLLFVHIFILSGQDRGWGTQGGVPPGRDGVPPSQVRTGGGVPPGRDWVPPGQVRMGGTQGGVPPDGIPPSQVRMGVAEVGYPQQGWGTPLWYRTADGVLDTSQSVCLLHSSRRTVLFEICFQSEKLRQ